MKLLLAAIISASLAGGAIAGGKPAPKVDCSLKKNATKLECKAPPKSDVKPQVKKPPKVERKAPAAVQKKADANNKNEEAKK